MWHTDAQQIFSFRGGGGDRFVEFCNTLILSETKINLIPIGAIRTMMKTTVGDGGVDTKIDQGSTHDTTGWFLDKAIWQYKASDGSVSDAELIKEINKDFSKECIQQGYAYRFCICDSITAEKVAAWEKVLDAEAKKINPNAPPAKVVTADDLAKWCSRYPAVVLRFFRRDLVGQMTDLNTHLMNIRSATPSYVDNPSWASAQDEIKKHIDLNSERPDPVLAIQGKAGVGKTRMVSELLARDAQTENLVLYSSDDQNVENIVRHLSISNETKAIIIADECSLNSRVAISRTISGHAGRIRVIAIDNQGENIDTVDPQFSLEKMSDELVLQILNLNFQTVPDDQRRLYANLSKGFVRMAADLCRQHAQIVASGRVGPTQQISTYYQNRLNPDQRKVVEALSLFPQVGFKDNVREHLDFVCAFSGVNRTDFESIANRLHDSPGFVGRGGRFYYVTPDIIAQVAFNFAWRNWVKNDPEAFFSLVPSTMIRLFVKRVSDYGREEERDSVTSFFRRWAEGVTPDKLASQTEIKMLEAVVEANPSVLLPVLRSKIEAATNEELSAIKGDWEGGSWGPRRVLVHLLERLACFQEYFFDCEICLLRLAINESELKIGNNSTETWKDFFRIQLSGTETPFQPRMTLLRTRLLSNMPTEADLAMKALEEIFDSHGSKVVGPPIVSGRLAPRNWQPKNRKEYRECIDLAGSLLLETSKLRQNSLDIKSKEIAIKYCRTLLLQAKLDILKDVFSGEIDEDLRIRLDSSISDFLHFDGEGIAKAGHEKYISDVVQWQDSLKPNDFHGRLVDLVGKESWDRSIRNEEDLWKKNLQDLATEFIQNPTLLHQELAWLSSAKAKSAGFLGELVGKLDSKGVFLLQILSAGLESKSSALARGYVAGLVQIYPQYLKDVNQYLDEKMLEHPNYAYDISIVVGKPLRAFTRTLELIDAGKIDIQFLRSFAFGANSTELSASDLKEVFVRIITYAKKANTYAINVGEDFLSSRLRAKKNSDEEVLEIDAQVKPLVWDFLEVEATQSKGGDVGYWWAKTLAGEFANDPERATKIAVQALIGDNYTMKDSAKSILSTNASKFGNLILKELEPFMFSEEKGWHFFIDDFEAIFYSLPVAEFRDWLKKHGVEAARKIARHLPSPHLGANDSLEVPEITKFVLEEFESDDRVFREFCAGRHSGQIYSGDIAGTHDQEAEVAKKFFGHPIKRIREWAKNEYEYSKANAKRWRDEDEERGFEDS